MTSGCKYFCMSIAGGNEKSLKNEDMDSKGFMLCLECSAQYGQLAIEALWRDDFVHIIFVKMT